MQILQGFQRRVYYLVEWRSLGRKEQNKERSLMWSSNLHVSPLPRVHCSTTSPMLPHQRLGHGIQWDSVGQWRPDLQDPWESLHSLHISDCRRPRGQRGPRKWWSHQARKELRSLHGRTPANSEMDQHKRRNMPSLV